MLQISVCRCVRTAANNQKFCGAFSKATSCAAAHRRFLCELSFAPFVSKESGVTGCSVKTVVNLQQYRYQNRKSAFSFCQYRHKKKKLTKRKMPFWGVSLALRATRAHAALDGHTWPVGQHLAGGAMRLRAREREARDFLKKVAQKLLIIRYSAPPLNYNLKRS